MASGPLHLLLTWLTPAPHSASTWTAPLTGSLLLNTAALADTPLDGLRAFDHLHCLQMHLSAFLDWVVLQGGGHD